MRNVRSYKQHAHLRQTTPAEPEYVHWPRPRGMRGLVCACCRRVWPCPAYVKDLHAADAELRAYLREGAYGHAATLAAAAAGSNFNDSEVTAA
jgi:L-asparaginase II